MGYTKGHSLAFLSLGMVSGQPEYYKNKKMNLLQQQVPAHRLLSAVSTSISLISTAQQL